MDQVCVNVHFAMAADTAPWVPAARSCGTVDCTGTELVCVDALGMVQVVLAAYRWSDSSSGYCFNPTFCRLCASERRPSVPPEQVLLATLLLAF